jgi:hypothetical protein
MSYTHPPGSISHGTLRPEDLIPTFMTALEKCAEADVSGRFDDRNYVRAESTRANLAKVQANIDRLTDEYFDSQDAQDDLDMLYDELGAYAPAGHYFGAHEGDGSDFGFWPFDDGAAPVDTRYRE